MQLICTKVLWKYKTWRIFIIETIIKKQKKEKPGKVFEADFFKNIPDDWTLVRLKDAGFTGRKEEGKDSKKRFTITNICDFILFDGYTEFLMELKTNKTTSIPETQLKQLKGLKKYKNKKNSYPVFVFNFRKYNETYIMSLEDIDKCLEYRKSIPISYCRDNGILVDQEIKISHYRYDLSLLRNEFVINKLKTVDTNLVIK